jgi:hypothetical protein
MTKAELCEAFAEHLAKGPDLPPPEFWLIDRRADEGNNLSRRTVDLGTNAIQPDLGLAPGTRPLHEAAVLTNEIAPDVAREHVVGQPTPRSNRD